MGVNADFSKPAFVRPSADAWAPSPMAGVERLMLDRIGEEKARATSVVRYRKNSRFSEHVHELGEEYFVLEGIFSDDNGDFGPMTYVRNPDGTRHAPWSEPGCVIFVKLRQFQAGDERQFAITQDRLRWHEDKATGIARAQLHEFGEEVVDYLKFGSARAQLEVGGPGGAEFFVLEGALEINGAKYPRWSWLRFPPGAKAGLTAAPGTVLYRKTGNYGYNT